MQPVDLTDLLLIAERVLDLDAHALIPATRIAEAQSALAAPYAGFGDREFYPDQATKAAILCSRLVRNHPFPDGNKRVAYLAMRIHFDRAGLDWSHPAGGQRETAVTIEWLAAGTLPEPDFVGWVSDRASSSSTET